MAAGVPRNSPYYYGGGGRAPIVPRRAPTPAATPRVPPTKPIPTPGPTMPPWYMTPEQQLALAQKEAQAFYQPQIDLYNKQQATMQANHAAQLAGIQELYKVLAGMFGGIGPQIQGIYQTAAQDQSAFGKGYSDGLQHAQNQAASDTSGQLAQLGLPGSENPGKGAANVLYALGGAIPANTLEQQGAAFGSAASFLPAEAGLQGQTQYLQAVQANNQSEQDLANQILALEGQIPGKAQDILSQIQQQQADYAKQSQPDIRSVGGNLVSIDPTTGKVSVLYQSPTSGTSAPPKTFRGPGGSTYAWQQTATGWKPVLIAQGTSPAATPPKTIAGPGGSKYAWTKTPRGWKLTQIIAPKAAAAGGGTTHYQHVTVNGKALVFDPATGQFLDPSTGRTVVPPGASARVSASTMAKGRKILATIGQTSYTAVTNPGQPLTTPQLRAIVNDYNRQAKAAGHTQITLANVAQMTPQELALLGISKQQVSPQQAYLQMVQAGIPARQAWQMVRRKYPNWGANYFRPKADAAQGAASPQAQQALALVREYLGTPYVWGGETPKGFDCSGLLQYVWGKVGINIPRTTYDQWGTGFAVPKSQLKPGDAVFFRGADSKGGKPGHVGMYIGSGQFIEAPRTGLRVRISSLSGRSDYMGARRYG